MEIRSWNDWAMIINDTHSVFSAIKRFSQHKMHKSFTPVNLVDKSAILPIFGRKVDKKRLDNTCYCRELPSISHKIKGCRVIEGHR